MKRLGYSLFASDPEDANREKGNHTSKSKKNLNNRFSFSVDIRNLFAG